MTFRRSGKRAISECHVSTPANLGFAHSFHRKRERLRGCLISPALTFVSYFRQEKSNNLSRGYFPTSGGRGSRQLAVGDLKYFKELFAEHRALSGRIPGKLFLTETDRKSRSVSFTTSVNYPQHHLFRIAHPSRACDDGAYARPEAKLPHFPAFGGRGERVGSFFIGF